MDKSKISLGLLALHSCYHYCISLLINSCLWSPFSTKFRNRSRKPQPQTAQKKIRKDFPFPRRWCFLNFKSSTVNVEKRSCGIWYGRNRSTTTPRSPFDGLSQKEHCQTISCGAAAEQSFYPSSHGNQFLFGRTTRVAVTTAKEAERGIVNRQKDSRFVSVWCFLNFKYLTVNVEKLRLAILPSFSAVEATKKPME